MLNQFSRTQLLYGKEAMDKLKKSRVAVFGVGGVGGYVVEALARSGVGSFDIIDDDKVCMTNINRQIIATFDTVGKYKVDVLKDRILAINPQAKVETYKCFFLPENQDDFDFTKYDYVVDAVDTVKAKIALIENCHKLKIRIISSMGTGNKLKPECFEITDVFKTSVCPLARVMRRELKIRGIKKCPVLYSKEQPQKVADATPGSVSFVPSVAGLMIAGYVIKELVKENK